MEESKQWATFKNTIILFVCPPKFCISVVFIFPWDHCKSQEKMDDKEYYGIFDLLLFEDYREGQGMIHEFAKHLGKLK